MVMVSYWDRGIGPLGTETNSSRTHKVPIVCVPHSPFLAPGDQGPVDSFEWEETQGSSRVSLHLFTRGGRLETALSQTWPLSNPACCVLAPRTCYPSNVFQVISKLFLSFPLQLHHPWCVTDPSPCSTHHPRCVIGPSFSVFTEVCSLLLSDPPGVPSCQASTQSLDSRFSHGLLLPL